MATTRPSRPFAWTRLTMRDAYKPRPPIPYVVDGLFREASVSMVFGPPGDLKTFLLLTCCACVAMGRDWLEPEPGTNVDAFRTMQESALFVDFDNGSDTLLDRQRAIGKAYNLPEDAPFWTVSMDDPWLDLTNMGGPAHNPNRVTHAMQLADTIRDWGARFVVLDNLGTIRGAADENSPEMAMVVSGLRYVANSTRAALVVLHHPVKTIGKGARKGNRLRGHGSIEAALDGAFLVERDGDLLTIESTKSRHSEIEPFAARWEYLHRPGTTVLEEARFWGAMPPSQGLDRQIRAIVLDILTLQGRLNQSEIVSEAKTREPKATRYRVRNALGYLVGRGLVMETPGPLKNASLYDLVVRP